MDVRADERSVPCAVEVLAILRHLGYEWPTECYVVDGHLCPLDTSSVLSAFCSLLIEEWSRHKLSKLDPRNNCESKCVA